MNNDLVIDENNFETYFRDTSKNIPEQGDVMAKFTSMAELVYGDLKQDIVRLLKTSDFGAKTSLQLMRKLGKASEKESLKLVRHMCADLYGGMTEQEVLTKSYSYILEMCFFTKKEYVPQNDLHWEVLTINNLDNFLDVKENYERDSEGRLVKKITISEKQ